MAKLIIRSFICLLLVMAASRTFAQHYMHDKPERPAAVEHRPPAPHPNDVWVDEDWKWSGGRYTFSGGHWVSPPVAHEHWVAGTWVKTRSGWRWDAGHWAR